MKIAVEGCCHGQIDATYSHIQNLEKQNGYKVDLLLICGDFQAIRNLADLQCMAVPQKYKALGEFYKYYTGEKIAPILTLVIGGNHEASNYMWELYHGGWLAPNIYFLGHAGCVRVNGIRIAGASGIYKDRDFTPGNYEKLPYTPNWLRSIYHIREFNIRRLSLLSQPTVFLSHDWPQSIEHYGNLRWLLSRKSFLQPDINTGNLGSPPLMGLLRNIRPKWWFSAHLHVRYEATVIHEPTTGPVEDAGNKTENPDEIVIDDEDLDIDDSVPPLKTASPRPDSASPPVKPNPDEITLEDEEGDVTIPSSTTSRLTVPVQDQTHKQGQITRFLALDKCLPRRQFLEVVDIPTPQQYASATNTHPTLEFDPEWLAITRAFHPLFSTEFKQPEFPDEQQARTAVALARQWITENLQNNDTERPLPINDVQTFVQTAPGPTSASPTQRVKGDEPQPPAYSNPQTEALCRMLDMKNKINPGAGSGIGDGSPT